MSNYIRKAEVVLATKFNVNEKPWPEGIVDGSELPIPVEKGKHVYGMPLAGSYLLVEDGEWIVTYPDGRKEVYHNDEFQLKFTAFSLSSTPQRKKKGHIHNGSKGCNKQEPDKENVPE